MQGQAPDPKDSAIRIVDAPGAKLYVKVSNTGQRLTVVSQAHMSLCTRMERLHAAFVATAATDAEKTTSFMCSLFLFVIGS